MPPFWNAVLGAIKGQQQATNGLAGGAPAGWVPDQFGNVTEIYGANLNQIVTIGAAHLQAGVLVSTGLPAGTAGHCIQSGPAITTITLTQGSASATVGTVTGILSAGQVIGAALTNDPTTGTPTSAITPGTTIASISGSSVTLSQVAAESGTNLYCAAARFILQQDTGWLPITLSSGFTITPGAYQVPAVRIRGDWVEMRGAIISNGSNTNWGTVPAAAKPASTVFPTGAAVANTLGEVSAGTPGTLPSPFISISTAGVITGSGITIPSGYSIGLDGLTYSLA